MSNSRYVYTSIKEFNKDGDYSFYGVIYDASFPVFEEKENLYHCTLKVIDTDVNPLTYPNNLADNILNLTVKSSDKEKLPYVHSVGDIIRVHKGFYRYKKKRNMYVNLTNITQIRSSWCVFAGASDLQGKDYNALACSSNNYTFDSQDKIKIDNFRSWIKLYFNSKNSLLYSKEFKLKNRNDSAPGDNDVLVQVVYKTVMDDKVVYFIQDETDGCELHAYKYFNFVEVNDVIRLRSFKVHDKNVLLMNKFSNILKIPPFTDLYKEMVNKIALKLKSFEPATDAPMFSTNGEKKIEDLMMVETPTNFGVQAIFDESICKVKSVNEIEDEDEIFVLNLNVVQIYPAQVYDYVSVMCSNCNMSVTVKEAEDLKDSKFTCQHCDSSQKCLLYYNVQLVCRENTFSNKLIVLHLSTFDDQGKGFFPEQADDISRNSKSLEKIKSFKEKLQEGYISVLVRAIKTGLGSSDRIYRIIGNYQNNLD